MLFKAHKNVLWFQITMNVATFMHVLASGYELISEEQNCLKRQFLSAVREQVFERWSEHLYNHDVVIAFFTRPNEFWKAGLAIDLF